MGTLAQRMLTLPGTKSFILQIALINIITLSLLLLALLSETPFCNATDCLGANRVANETFGVCQVGDCAGQVCKNTPLPIEYNQTLPFNATECIGNVVNSSSETGYCLHGDFADMVCTPSCPLAEVSCSTCAGWLDVGTGLGV